jgi:hypothetical protein
MAPAERQNFLLFGSTTGWKHNQNRLGKVEAKNVREIKVVGDERI